MKRQQTIPHIVIKQKDEFAQELGNRHGLYHAAQCYGWLCPCGHHSQPSATAGCALAGITRSAQSARCRTAPHAEQRTPLECSQSGRRRGGQQRVSSNGSSPNLAVNLAELVAMLQGLVLNGADPDCVMVLAPDGEQFFAGQCVSDEGTLTIIGTH